MRDISKMAELKFEAPLAQFESEEWGVEFSDFQSTQDARNSNKDANGGTAVLTNGLQQNPASMTAASNGLLVDTAVVNSTAAVVDNAASALRAASPSKMGNGELGPDNPLAAVAAGAEDNFTETFSGSLEDLVNTFDDKITKCFCNYEESVEKLAPVQVRSQEEIMNECQMWWTITGNFGNILPIDWSKSYARKLHIPTLNLNENKGAKGNGARRRGHHGSRKNGCDEKEEASNDGEEDDDECEDDDEDDEDDDEAVACDLDMHSLILSGLRQNGDDEDETPLKTADEVIREIDDMMQETPSTECSVDSDRGSLLGSTDALDQKGKEVLQSPLYEDKLKALSVSQLNELYLELEVLIREFSETLIAELALRDELEYEKELKNTFISLLLAVQNRRRQFHVERKRNSRSPKPPTTANGLDPKYLTTVIPYHLGSGPPDNQALQVLIKILKAINEDSPTVPTLLTDYILKVLCPT